MGPLPAGPMEQHNLYSQATQTPNKKGKAMAQSGVITFKGNPMTLAGEALEVGSKVPAFELHYAENGIQTLTLDDLKGKPSIISVVPSLDTPTCAVQTKKFNEELAAMADKINAVTVSRDLPFAQARFCGAEDIKMRTASDYQTHAFGTDYGLTIEELKLLTRAVFVLNADGEIAHKEVVSEVTEEPDYATAMAALRMLV